MTETPPDPKAEWWTTSDVAAYLGVGIATVSSYNRREQMPLPDKTIGRTHIWKPARIIGWHQSRPRPGVGGRPVDRVVEGRSTAGSAPTPTQYDPPVGTEANDTRWMVHGRRPIYESPWVRLEMVDVELPDGQRFEHHTVWLPPAAMTALLNDEGTHVLLMWRHRFVSDLWNWELPGGLIEEGEDPAVTAAREVEEETGYRARRLEHVVTFEPMIGMVASPHHVFVGHGAERIGSPTETTEMQRMEWTSVVDVPGLIASGMVRNSGTLVALLHVLAFNGPDHPRSRSSAGG